MLRICLGFAGKAPSFRTGLQLRLKQDAKGRSFSENAGHQSDERTRMTVEGADQGGHGIVSDSLQKLASADIDRHVVHLVLCGAERFVLTPDIGVEHQIPGLQGRGIGDLLAPEEEVAPLLGRRSQGVHPHGGQRFFGKSAAVDAGDHVVGIGLSEVGEAFGDHALGLGAFAGHGEGDDAVRVDLIPDAVDREIPSAEQAFLLVEVSQLPVEMQKSGELTEEVFCQAGF